MLNKISNTQKYGYNGSVENQRIMVTEATGEQEMQGDDEREISLVLVS